MPWLGCWGALGHLRSCLGLPLQVSVRVTYEAGDVHQLVGEALALAQVDTLVAAGGDGTLNEVVAALLDHTGGCLGNATTRSLSGLAGVGGVCSPL